LASISSSFIYYVIPNLPALPVARDIHQVECFSLETDKYLPGGQPIEPGPALPG
jgi:hypothetical protein